MAAACDNCVAGINCGKPDAVVPAPKYGDPYTYDCGTLYYKVKMNMQKKERVPNQLFHLNY